MKKEDIIYKLRQMNYDSSDYWVLAGSGLVMHGIRENTGDIDLGCNEKLFDLLIKEGHDLKLLNDGMRYIQIDSELEIFENWFVEKIEYINAIPVASLESIKTHKEKLGREKDLKDIKLIDQYLKG